MKLKLKTQVKNARRGQITTTHGKIETPFFMPISTAAAIKGMSFPQLKQAGAQITLSNTYHLHLSPGEKLIKKAGGLHQFMNWDGPILTDSGGYQVYSLAKQRKITEKGVKFNAHNSGKAIMLTPEKAIQIQHDLGSDIIMAFDVCQEEAEKHKVKRTMDLTTRWEERCLKHHKKLLKVQRSKQNKCEKQAFSPARGDVAKRQRGSGGALFGIMQGSTYPDLRVEHAKQLVKLGFDGYAHGGLATGEKEESLYEMLEVTNPHLPQDQPRYLMGIGTPVNIVESVARGIDMFDCVLPTRNARHGNLYTSQGHLNIRLEKFKNDLSPLDPKCSCPTCQNHSRAYLRHLLKQNEIMAYCHLVTHNIYYYLDLMYKIRQSIEERSFEKLRKDINRVYNKR
jgi:queuine tRNA-ribosyltransferase